MLQKYMMAKEFYTTEKAGLIQQSMHRYSISSYILFFFTFSFAGWIWEVLLHVFIDHTVVNRGCPLRSVASNLRIRRGFDSPPAPPLCRKTASGLPDDHADSRDDGIRHGNRAVEGLSDALVGLYRDSLINLKGFVCLEGLLLFGTGGLCDPLFRGAEIKRSVPGNFRIHSGRFFVSVFLAFSYAALDCDASKCRIRGDSAKAIIRTQGKRKS